ncbi:MAG: hypothetical protein MUE82_05180 [Chloroflexi bacterium]|jgi:hypothetical protein|nr:hypothetical protein [Chloroflexota bacterium]
MARTTLASLPRSPRRRLTHRPGTPRGAILRLSALAGALSRLDAEGRREAGWSVQPADHDVSTILGHLVPIRSRAALAASYAREGRHILDPERTAGSAEGGRGGTVDALDLAYALRWIELEDGRLRA